MSDFESSVLKGLEKCGVSLAKLAADGGVLGVAVSGGADSVSLLISLAELCKNKSIPLKAITVNHFIREEKETCGDVEYVSELCKRLASQGYNITLKIHELKKGEVALLAEQKGIGVEAAARELRYAAFEDFIHVEKLNYLCLAHNKNDQLETLLMRFIQGAGSDSSSGIPCVRQKFMRPLLWTDRSEIEQYLKQKGIQWCTDSTNEDASYLRNRIRKELVPLLNDRFYGWDKGVLQGAQKFADDSMVLKACAQDFMNNHAVSGCDSIQVDEEFYKLDRALKIRVLLACANEIGFELRIPYVFLLDICDYADNIIEEKSEKKGDCMAVKCFANLEIVLKNNGVFVKKAHEMQNETVFSVIIEHSGIYEFPWGQFFIPKEFDFPVLCRNWNSDDRILAADGTTRKVSDILSSWHVREDVRHYIPVVQVLNEPEQNVLGILGSCLGYKDWIVRNEKM